MSLELPWLCHCVYHNMHVHTVVGTPTWQYISFHYSVLRLSITAKHSPNRASKTAHFMAPASKYWCSRPCLPTTEWQSRLANRNLYKKRPPSRPRDNPSIPKTNHCGGWPNRWWEFRPVSPPDHPKEIRSLRLWESQSPCRQSGGLVSTSDRSFGPSNYWEGWRGAEVLPHDLCQRTQVNQPWGGSGSHQGSQGQQGSGSERCSEQSLEISPTASSIPPGPDLQCDPPHLTLP